MNQQQIEQYATGKMGEAEAEAFEILCVSNPELARQVELEQRLRAGLAQVARGSTSEFIRAEPPNYWKYAAAASVLLMLAALFAWRTSVAPVRILTATAPAATHAGASMRLALVRGTGGLPRLPAGPAVRVEIVGLFDPEARYSVALDHLGPNHGIDTVDALAGQKPASPVTLEIIIDGAQLESGTYALRVRRQSSDDEALEFRFLKP